MRFSPYPALTIAAPSGKHRDNREFFAAVIKSLTPEQLHCSVLLLGGRDARSLAIRQAQRIVRFDRVASAWSHAAIITRPRAGVASAGVEVTLHPRRVLDQRAADNGVTRFTLKDYLETREYPNVAILSFGDDPTRKAKQAAHKGSAQLKQAMTKALAEPNADRVRYPLWDQLAPWAAYAYAPDTTPNPLLSGQSLPAASLCELAFSAAGIDIAPGAVDRPICPEHLWATFKRWGSRLQQAAGLEIRAYAVIRDRFGVPEEDSR